MTTENIIQKVVEIPFEGLLIKVTYPQEFIEQTNTRHHVTVLDSQGMEVHFLSSNLPALFLELKTKTDWAKEGKRAQEYVMPSVIEQIGVGADAFVDYRPRFSAQFVNPPVVSLAPVVSFLCDPVLERVPKWANQPTEEKSGGSPIDSYIESHRAEHDRFVESLISASNDGLTTNTGPQGVALDPEAKYQTVSMCECIVCNGDGYSVQAKQIKKRFDLELKHKLTQGDVLAMVADGCLKSLTHCHNGQEWVVNSALRTPTSEEVMAWAENDAIGFDSSCISAVVKYRLSLFGMSDQCQVCKGTGQTLQPINR
jgi:hypothetical protein